MLIISDSPIFLLTKIAKSKNIIIKEIINLVPECHVKLPKDTNDALILITESFYSILENNNYYDFELDENIKSIFELIETLINKLINLGTQIYIPFVPTHFIYCDRFGESFYDIPLDNQISINEIL